VPHSREQSKRTARRKGYWPDLVGGMPTPLKNKSSSVGMMTFPTEWKVIKFHGSKPPTSDQLKPVVFSQSSASEIDPILHYLSVGGTYVVARYWPAPMSSTVLIKQMMAYDGIIPLNHYNYHRLPGVILIYSNCHLIWWLLSLWLSLLLLLSLLLCYIFLLYLTSLTSFF